MKRFIVFKFFGEKIHVFITYAVDAETALLYYHRYDKFIGTFNIDGMYGDGGIAIEIENEMMNASLFNNPIRIITEYQKLMQNNTWIFRWILI